VLLELSEVGLDVVATDRYWLTCRTLAVTGPRPAAAVRVVLARKDADAAATWLARRDLVTIELTTAGLRLAADETVTWEGEPDRFPAHRMLLDGQPEPRGRVDVGRAELARALTDDAARIAVGDDRVWVTGPGGGEGVRLAATTVGDPVTIHFASPLLGKVLDVLVGDTVRIAFAAPDRAVRITSPEQAGVVVLAMPILATT
jgi:DNA polymerase III sliding clamp (beta) subunit (PCNA family)